jgi:hypothetical protein
MLQSALYAAEMMSHAIWISHAIKLVIIGEPPYICTILFLQTSSAASMIRLSKYLELPRTVLTEGLWH